MAAMQGLREGRCRRHGADHEEAVERFRRRRKEVAIPAQHRSGVGQVIQDRSGHDVAHRMAAELEGGDHPEVTSAAA
ncbi:hypothetical protein Q427_16495 [Halomonas sp. BC04]|nr:hypothetical protein Q427_16495 [Halomonas sp. BC04]